METTGSSGVPPLMVNQLISMEDSKSSSPKDVIFSSCSLSSGSFEIVESFQFPSQKAGFPSEYFHEPSSISSLMHSQNEKTAKIFKKNQIISQKTSTKSNLIINDTPLVDIQLLAANASNQDELSFSQHAIEDVKKTSKKYVEETCPQPEKKKRSSLTRTLSKKKLSSRLFSPHSLEEESKEVFKYSHTQKQVTCEELIFKGFDHIDESLLTNMIPLERTNLSIALKNTIKKIENVLGKDQTTLQNFNLLQLDDDYKRNCESLFLVEVVQKKFRDNQLIELIEQNSNNFWDCLSLAGEKILSSQELFVLISAHIEQLGQYKVHEKMMSLLSFCSHWLRANQGNKLVKKVKIEIKEIVRLANNHTKDYFQNESKNLFKNLNFALCVQKLNYNQINFTSINFIDLNAFLNEICSQKIEKNRYKEIVEMTVKDLCYSQLQFYNQITPGDFFEENLDTPSMVQLMGNHCNLIASYVIQTVFCKKTLEESVLLMQFFLEVGYRCLSENDYSSACAIGGIFTNWSFDSKSDLWIKLTSNNKRYIAIYDKFNKIFYGKSTQSLRMALENCYKNDKFFIPYMGIYLHDIEIFKNHPAIIESEDKDPEYNFIKIKGIYNAIQISLCAQEKWNCWGGEKYIYKTNLLSQILPSFQHLKGITF